ncbi:HEPN domain-containing protein [Candidatus Micrarchaeota archaeon]|nr:HEPN domain-containing protein [Candidatus Micrarchaeota archaeon]
MDKLDKCFQGFGSIPPRLIKKKPDISVAEDHLEKANRNLFAAKLMNDNKFFDWAITCGYYAMYHATMASLWLIGLEARSHECAISAFEIFYVKEQKVGKEYLDYLKKAKTLNRKYAGSLEYAKTQRIKASYGLGEITSQESSKVLSDAREFVATVGQLALEAKGLG